MKYEIILDSFEGPLDLLLNLIQKSKLDIYDIPINIITEQYIDYIYEMEGLNLDIASDFLIMASTLLQIKSRMLLPIEKVIVDGEEVEIDPREELVLQILSYKKFKEAAEQLREVGERESMAYYKPKEDLSIFDKEDMSIGPFDLNLLIKSINSIINKKKVFEHSFDISEINRDEYSIKECSDIIMGKLESQKQISFIDLLNINTSRNEIIAYFLSLLELTKVGHIAIKQDRLSKNLTIIKLDSEEHMLWN